MVNGPSPTGRPKTLILDIYGMYVRQLGGWLAVSDLVLLMGHLGVDEQAVRSAVSRMMRRNLLLKERRGAVSGYRLSEEGYTMMEEADHRIFITKEPAELADGWVLVSFSMPESERDKRHVLRSRLTWLGFGNLSSGLWIAPRRSLAELRETIRRLGFEDYVDVFDGHYRGFDQPSDVVRRTWDLDTLRRLYAEFLFHWDPVLDRVHRRAPDDLGAFVSYTMALHEWRKLPYLDPGLPAEVLPHNWEGRRAADTFHALHEHLVQPANRHVETVTTVTLQARTG